MKAICALLALGWAVCGVIVYLFLQSPAKSTPNRGETVPPKTEVVSAQPAAPARLPVLQAAPLPRAVLDPQVVQAGTATLQDGQTTQPPSFAIVNVWEASL
jgi:hypothetical protein